MNIVKFKNRDGDIITFEELSENVYKFDSSFKMGWRMGFEVGKNVGKTITFVDPPGGPFVGIGYIIPEINKEVTSIESGNNDVILKTK